MGFEKEQSTRGIHHRLARSREFPPVRALTHKQPKLLRCCYTSTFPQNSWPQIRSQGQRRLGRHLFRRRGGGTTDRFGSIRTSLRTERKLLASIKLPTRTPGKQRRPPMFGSPTRSRRSSTECGLNLVSRRHEQYGSLGSPRCFDPRAPIRP